jgi:site-specific DNA-methyltransferase (adenine-specific)
MKKYEIIYADPAWNFGNSVYQDNGRDSRLLEKQYPSMSIKEIKELPLANISADDCALFLWTTDFHLPNCFELFEAWGFKYRTIAFVWVKKTKNGKTCANLGAWTMKNTEICLLATKGNMFNKRQVKNLFQLVEAERTKHSKKPQEVRNRIEKLFGNMERLEMFAREKHDGWDAWGNEVENSLTFLGEEKNE